MIGFTPGELKHMRDTQEGAMQDTCVVLPVVETESDYGEIVHSWPTDGATYPCGVDTRSAKETAGQNHVTEYIDVTLRLPIDAVVDEKDHIRVTHRFGEVLAVPLEFAVVGSPRRGPSGLRVDVQRVRL